MLAGGMMSFGQTVAPDAIAPLFNSAAPVVAVAAAVSLAARGPWSHVTLGALAGPLVMVGYYATASLRGFGVSASWVVLWCVAGVLFGAVMGLAVWLLRGHGAAWLRPLAAAVLPSVAVGEAAHGLARISESTPVGYWWAQAAIGVAVLAWTVATRLTGVAATLVACGATAAGAAAVFAAYGAF